MVVCPPELNAGDAPRHDEGIIPRLLWPSTVGMMSIDGNASVSSHEVSFGV
jgi:hypothetical protein